eukprot:GFUD01029963.1.p1 GENE.GFUD01029963.1~~GFUD01029963.1.p1  ORF type:complete len:554 (-),score=119.52 GFUD01029963.1:50-1711(-)
MSIYLSKIEMARDITDPETDPNQDVHTNVVKATFFLEKIILLSNKKVGQDEITYIQVHLSKLPKNRSVNEESSEHIPPTSQLGSEITFVIPKAEAFFPLPLRIDALDDLEQYEVELEIMKNGERKLVGAFGICLADIESQHFQKTKLRKIDSQMKSIQAIEIKYKVFEGNPNPLVQNTNLIQVSEQDTTQQHQGKAEEIRNGAILNSHENDTTDEKLLDVTTLNKLTEKCRPNFRKNSCVVVLGTTGRGKTTTMNLFTGNTASTGHASHSTTKANQLYRDILPEHWESEDGVGYPVWLDTVGLDESDADVTNGDLVRSYLRVLQCSRIEWVHAVVWCITPEDKKLQYLKDQAEVIKMFGEKSQNIWKNVVIIAKEGKSLSHDLNFQGALAAVSDLEGGHQDIVSSIQCLEYDLDFENKETSDNARQMINKAFWNIKEPIRVVFSNQVCQDCGQKGDERLISDFCHEAKSEVERKFFSSYLPKKSVCSSCQEDWSRKIFGRWSFTEGLPCVRIRNRKDIKQGETMARGKTMHDMVKYKPLFGFLNCAQSQPGEE